MKYVYVARCILALSQENVGVTSALQSSGFLTLIKIKIKKKHNI